MNLPNKLTIARLFMIPIFVTLMFVQGIDNTLQRLLVAGLFFLTGLTDYVDGYIARKHNLVTNFGKFLDPLADKVMIMGALLGLMVMARDETATILIIATMALVTMFRETLVSGLRMLVSGDTVIAADKMGKLKTITQFTFVLVALIEPIFFEHRFGTYILAGLTVYMVVHSGMNYFIKYKGYINPNK
ncbi:MAG: CDP-diacylglycerol--glycerol-3-phosphate 3-phosphatidyltransferase [Oscillospiraceae bacterium]|nr:CDP-diacylglycerol--glycerol-3-phosphate 3-phosphatidyltransferase [Oscillospiraceae bacterium]